MVSFSPSPPTSLGSGGLAGKALWVELAFAFFASGGTSVPSGLGRFPLLAPEPPPPLSGFAMLPLLVSFAWRDGDAGGRGAILDTVKRATAAT